MSKRDCYEVLGVSRTVAQGDLKKSFRRVAMKYHPDRNPDDAEALEKFKEAKEAYDILSDPQKRQMYDQYGHAAFENGGMGGRGGAGFGDMGDVFGDIFGDIFGGGRGGSRVQRGADLRYIMELDLEEAVFGVDREIEIPTLVSCDECKGSGSEDGNTVTCATCGGQGRVRMQNGIFSIQQTCPHCGGSGQRIEKPCKRCHGQGRVEDKRTLSVNIPAGVDNGDRIRLTGQGEAAPSGGQAGDLYVEVHVREHAIFQRDGNDLHCEVPIRFGQVALGTTLKVPTLEGEVDIHVPPETQSGQSFRLRGRGVKSVRGGRTGDLICQVTVETPVHLSAEQKKLLEAFEATFADTEAAEEHSPRAGTWKDGVKKFFSRMTA